MSRRQIILASLERVAQALGDDRERAVFVGGAAAALYESPWDVRATVDVDVTVRASGPQYLSLLGRLRRRGFQPCREEGAPICRLVLDGKLQVDVMPSDPSILGFSNRWYESAIEAAETFVLPGGTRVRALPALYFVATKMEAFLSRGRGDVFASHDLEDVLSALATFPEVLVRISSDDSAVASYLREQLSRLCHTTDFLEAIAGHFDPDPDGQARAAALTTALSERFGSTTQ